MKNSGSKEKIYAQTAEGPPVKEYRELTEGEWAVEGLTKGGALLAKRARAIDATQGSELPLEITDPELFEILKNGTGFQGKPYHNDTGGDNVMREAFANHHLTKTYRFPATLQQVFACQGLARGGIKFITEEALRPHTEPSRRQGYDPIVYVPRSHWATTVNMFRGPALQMRVELFDHDVEDWQALLGKKIEDNGAEHAAAVLYVTTNNYDGVQMTRIDTRKLFHVLDKLNARPGVNIYTILDPAYSYGCPAAEDEHGRYIVSGLEQVFHDDWQPTQQEAALMPKDWQPGPIQTRWGMVKGGSKDVVGSADGFQFLVFSANQDLAAIGKRLSDEGPGQAGDRVLMSNYVHRYLADPEIFWRRHAYLHGKYKRNSEIDNEYVGRWLSGHSETMLAALKIPAELIKGKEVTLCNGTRRVLKSGIDVVTYLANNYGIAISFMKENEGGNLVFRLARREEPDVYLRGMKNLGRGLFEITGLDPRADHAHEKTPQALAAEKDNAPHIFMGS